VTVASIDLTDIDYDQTGYGETYAVSELRAQLPRTARITRRIPGPDRDDYFSAIFTRPIKYHPAPQFDWARTQPGFIAADGAGQFLWISAIIIASLQRGSHLHSLMKDFPVYVAYVVDNTVGLDDRLDFAKCDSIGWGTINALPDSPAPPTI
jgi:hypothetical protein